MEEPNLKDFLCSLIKFYAFAIILQFPGFQQENRKVSAQTARTLFNSFNHADQNIYIYSTNSAHPNVTARPDLHCLSFIFSYLFYFIFESHP